MIISQNLTAIVALFFIGVSGDSDTCCYGAKCPLPIFVQYGGDDYDALYGDDENPGVVDKDACCPDGHHNWLGLNDQFDITYGGTIDTACLCGQDQSCNGDSYTLYGPMCTSQSSVTSTSCPDAFVEDIDSSTGCIDLGAGCVCQYSVTDSGTRAMTQRCVPEKVCVNGDIGAYEIYTKNGFRNGFPLYYEGSNKILAVDAPGDGYSNVDYARWVIRALDVSSTVLAYANNSNGFVTEGFDDPSGFSWSNGVSIMEYTGGVCVTPHPTRRPTAPTAPTTPRPTRQPSAPTPQPTEGPSPSPTNHYNSGQSGGCRDIVIIGIYVLILCVVLRI